MPRLKTKKPPVKRPSFEEKREKWKAEVFKRLEMNVALEDQYTGATYPEPPSLDKSSPGSRTDYIKDRLNAGALVALERRLKRLSMTIPGSKEAQQLESDILDRAGFTRKPQTNLVSTGPVLFINGSETANALRGVYEKQRALVEGGDSVLTQAAYPVIEAGEPEEEPEHGRDDAEPDPE